MKQNKIYLSLDDLNKLYGITPSVLNAIKKKQKQRKNKRLRKKKINNKNMNNHKSSSDHMVISSNLLSTETQKLNVANIQKHIDDINKNNKLLVENNIPEHDDNYDQYKDFYEGVKAGKYHVKQLPNGIQIKNKDLNKKPGPKPKSKQVEELEEIPKQTKTKRFDFLKFSSPVKLVNPLTNVNTNLMNRNLSEVIAEDLDDGFGNIPDGTNSDNFIISDGTDNLQVEEEKVENIDEPNIGIETVNIPIDEPKASLETVNEPILTDYTFNNLKKIAIDNNVKSTFKKKKDLFDFLREKNYI